MNRLNQRNFTTLAGFLFLLMATGHALRLVFKWDAVIGGWSVPHWVSLLAIGLLGALAYAAFNLKR